MGSSALLPRTPMLRTIFLKTMRDQRRALVWWTLGLLGTALITVAFWPSIKANAAEFTSFLERLPASIRELFGATDFATPEGYLEARLFSFLAPILLLVYGIGSGARAIAGEEEAGTLDALLATPTRRGRVVMEKFSAMVAGIAVLVSVTWVSLVFLGPVFDLDVPVANVTAACLNLALLSVAFGSLALTIGAATGSKALAIGGTSGAALITFLLRSFAASVDWLEPYRVLSPFHYYIGHDPLRTGVNGTDALVLVAITGVALAVALVTFERRDLAA